VGPAALALDRRAVGIGLRTPHYRDILEQRPALGFLEAHSENFFAAGGPTLAWLERFRADYALSFHGVGLSLGSTDPLDAEHLRKLRALVERFEPALVSEHLCWSSFAGRHANDLLPLPFTREALDHVVARIGQAQEYLGRRILVENVSSYLAFDASTLPEWEFVAEVARRSGCALLLDVNNIYVNAANHHFDAHAYLDAIDPHSVGEFHLAGFEMADGRLIDTHGSRVADGVWSLYAAAVERIGERPTLVEWDCDIPALEVLLEEAAKARSILAPQRANAPSEALA
jgi:uncharacterized protein (UPF0276 family)